MEIEVISDIGLVRQKNEDSYLVNKTLGLLAVCDGMGGHNGGDVASATAVREIENYMMQSNDSAPMKLLNDGISSANYVIFQEARLHPALHDMGTTVTAALIDGTLLYVANVGDSSLYIIRNKNIRKITRDHTLAEQMVCDGLLKSDEIAKSPYRNILTRALGVEDKVTIDNFEEQLYPEDIMLLCSDGLSDMITADDMLFILNTNYDLEQAAREMLKASLASGGHDNITIMLVRV